ncbi:MAG: SGNH/GDSL hydrolase family protein [Rhodomicrobium sp.]
MQLLPIQTATVRITITRVVPALLLCIAITEICLRLIFGLGTPVLILPDKGEAQGGYGYIPAPDQNVRRFFARNKINHFSMRSDDFSVTKPANHFRVLFIGDSVTYGTTYIDQTHIFTSLVASGLPERIGCSVDVLNVSAGGWAPSNEVGFLKRKGTFEADIVIIVLNTADLNQPFAGFQPGPGFPTEQPLTALGEAWTRYLAPRLLGAQGVAPDPGSIPSQPIAMAEQTSGVLAKLEEARTYTLAHNAVFGVVYIPSRSKIWDGADFQLAKKMLVDWAKSNNVPLADLTRDFAGKALDEVYLDKGDAHIHLTSPGHRIVASRLLEWLTATPDLPPKI